MNKKFDRFALPAAFLIIAFIAYCLWELSHEVN